MDTVVIVTRLQKLDGYLQSLRQLAKAPLNEYLADENIQSIVERRLQLAIQVCIDVANYLIAHLGLRAPDELDNVFVTLGRESLISPDLADSMVGMVRFRNILVHDYLDINQKLVHAQCHQVKASRFVVCHCEEQSDEAIPAVACI